MLRYLFMFYLALTLGCSTSTEPAAEKKSSIVVGEMEQAIIESSLANNWKDGERSPAEITSGSNYDSGSRSKKRAGVGSRVRGKKSRRSGGGSASSAPIWGPFMSRFRQCAPGCSPWNYGTWGHRSKPTCHSTGEAIDVGGISCGGKIYAAINRGRFATFVQCMAKKGMRKLYFNGPDVTQGHKDHAHFSFGCSARSI